MNIISLILYTINTSQNPVPLKVNFVVRKESIIKKIERKERKRRKKEKRKERRKVESKEQKE